MNKEFETTIPDILIAMLFSGKSIKNFKSIIRERKLERYKTGSVRVALSRLSKNGYIHNTKNGWQISASGVKYIDTIKKFSYIQSPFKNEAVFSTIVSFDIPGPERKVRDWLRNQLKKFNYKMLQQSLWIGPGPLPTKFLERLEILKIRKCIKIFKIKK